MLAKYMGWHHNMVTLRKLIYWEKNLLITQLRWSLILQRMMYHLDWNL